MYTLTEDQIKELQFYNGRISLLLGDPQPELTCWASCLADRIIELSEVITEGGEEPPQSQADFFELAEKLSRSLVGDQS